MAKTSGGVRGKVLGLKSEPGKNMVRLKNTNWNAKGARKIAYAGYDMVDKRFFGVIANARKVGLTRNTVENLSSARTERQLLSWMKKRGFVPR